MHILSIVGPTAVGKSAAAVAIAEMLLATSFVDNPITGVDLISADSRQVYRGLEILSGADVPEAGERVEADGTFAYPYFRLANSKMVLHGVAIIQPTEEWSLAHFHQMALGIIDQAEKNSRAVIVVGGTGLYQTQLLQAELESQSPPQLTVREKAEGMSVEELQTWLGNLDANMLADLNQSDRANTRRLIRAIERTLWKQSIALSDEGSNIGNNPHGALIQKQEGHARDTNHTQHFFGIQTTKEDLVQRIRQRVEQRLAYGVVNEVTLLESRLEELGLPLAKLPTHSACGLKEVLAFARGEIDREQCIELWTHREISYAKRQETWWKKHPEVQWFDIGDPNWQAQLLTSVGTLFPANTPF